MGGHLTNFVLNRWTSSANGGYGEMFTVSQPGADGGGKGDAGKYMHDVSRARACVTNVALCLETDSARAGHAHRHLERSRHTDDVQIAGVFWTRDSDHVILQIPALPQEMVCHWPHSNFK